MAIKNNGNALLHLRTLFDVGAIGALSDGQLLERFATGRGEPRELAFAALVERHGPFVLRVCRSILRDEDAAEDAFQATFLALARKAGSLWAQDSLAPWLHQTAYRAAVHDRSAASRRRSHEHTAAALRRETVSPPHHGNNDDLERIIHEEIERLPDSFRVAVLLVDIEGRTHEQAARHLGCAVGTVKSRLARGRKRLRGQLVRRGMAPAAAIAAAAGGGAARAAVPTRLAASTVVYASTANAVPTSVAVITEGVLRSMFLSKIKLVTTAAAVMAAFAAGAVALAQSGIGKPKVETGKPQQIVVTSPKAIDVNITQRYVCKIHARQHINVCALENGYLSEIHVKEGQVMKKGDLMFKIAPLRDQADPILVLANVTAPFDGIIGRLHQQQGSLLKEGDTLTTLSDTSAMWVYFNVPDNQYLEYLANGAKDEEDSIELELANHHKFPQTGKIGAIEAQINEETGNAAVRADFPNSNRLLRHGQTGTVLVHRRLLGAIVIPQRATIELLDKRYVYVVGKDDLVHRREIVPQHEVDDIFVIKKGVGVTDKIVLEGIREIHDGDMIEYEFRPLEEVRRKPKTQAE
jgi:membrane fusion protein, multidrug efflux system